MGARVLDYWRFVLVRRRSAGRILPIPVETIDAALLPPWVAPRIAACTDTKSQLVGVNA
ncbi:MAG: hypothetical protein VX424_05865 [Actinomycetota bacterium]|nr:hypothetical protein [Actinomycetota bacterium]